MTTKTRKKWEVRISTANPQEILEMAEQEAAILSRSNSSPIRYAPACEVLRGKGYSWRMIADWLEERGVYYSTNALSDATKKWGQSDEYVAWLTSKQDKEQELEAV